jgi:hypothetical protein
MTNTLYTQQRDIEIGRMVWEADHAISEEINRLDMQRDFNRSEPGDDARYDLLMAAHKSLCAASFPLSDLSLQRHLPTTTKES